jgi:hypothetical protein
MSQWFFLHNKFTMMQRHGNEKKNAYDEGVSMAG